MVVVVANRIPIADGWEQEFERRWVHRKWSIAKLPGFLGTEVLRPVKGNVYIVQTHWRSMDDFERWTRSAAFGDAHADPPPRDAFAGPNVLEIHEVFAAKEGRPRTGSRKARPAGGQGGGRRSRPVTHKYG